MEQVASPDGTTISSLREGHGPPLVLVLKAATERVHAALPTSRIAVLPGQQHIAMNTAPELFLREVVAFLLEE